MITFTLMDGVKLNAARPDKFAIPRAEEKALVEPGDNVKLGFIFGDMTERMWVQINRIDGVHYHGELNNDPVLLPMTCGEPVTFEAQHMLVILKKNKQLPAHSGPQVVAVCGSCNVDTINGAG